MADFIAFSDFIDRTDSTRFHHVDETMQMAVQRSGLERLPMPAEEAKPEGGRRGAARKAAGGEVDIEDEFTRMKKFILEYYKGVKTVVHSFLDRAGNHIDCIPFEEQPSYRAAKAAKFKLRDKASAAVRKRKRRKPTGKTFGPLSVPLVPPLRLGLTDTGGRKLYCPEGSVPIRRITLPQLAHLGKLDRFFQKTPPPNAMGPLPVGGQCGIPAQQSPDRRRHRYAVASCSEGPFFGCASSMSVWGPETSPNGMSLGQLWVVRQMANGYRQTVEGGWQVNPAQWHTNAPVLFVFFNPDNYGGQGGYVTNPGSFGFIQSSRDWVIGAELPVSTINGDQRGFRMQWERKENGDWVLYWSSDNPDDDLHELGYFPGALYESNNQVSGDFNVVQFGGEVAGEINSESTGPMGSGVAPSAAAADPEAADPNWRRVAYQNHLAIQTKSGGQWEDPALVADHSCAPNYDLVLDTSNDWGTFMFFGGDRAN